MPEIGEYSGSPVLEISSVGCVAMMIFGAGPGSVNDASSSRASSSIGSGSGARAAISAGTEAASAQSPSMSDAVYQLSAPALR